MRRRLTAVLPATLINISSKARPLQLFQMFAEVVCSVLACMLLLLFFTAHSRCSILISNYIQTYWQNVWISRILVFRFATVHFSDTIWSFSFAFDWVQTDAKAAVASMGNRLSQNLMAKKAAVDWLLEIGIELFKTRAKMAASCIERDDIRL